MFSINPFRILLTNEVPVTKIIYDSNTNNFFLISKENINIGNLDGTVTNLSLPKELSDVKSIKKASYHSSTNQFALIYDNKVGIFNKKENNLKLSQKIKTSNPLVAFNKSGTIIAFKEEDTKLQILWLEEKKKKSVKDIEYLDELFFSIDTVKLPYLFALGEEVLIISYEKGKIIKKIFFPCKQGLFTHSGDKLILLAKTANIVRIYQSHGLESNPKLINEIYPRFSQIRSLLLTPDSRILVLLSTEGIELIDITIPQQEVTLIWTKMYKNFIHGCFYPNSSLITVDSNQQIFLWKQPLHLDQFREIFKEFNHKIDEIHIELRKIPQWVLEGDMNTLKKLDLEIAEQHLKDVRSLLRPSIITRFRPPNFPFWIIEDFESDLTSLRLIEEKSLRALKEFDEELEKEREKIRKKNEKYQQLAERCIFYLKSFASGSKVSTEKIANYLSLTSAEADTLLQRLEREKQLPPGRLIRNIFGKLDFVAGYEAVMVDDKIERTDTYSCYYCTSEVISADTHCSTCQREILRCSSCEVPISRNQEQLKCFSCSEPFHYTCYLEKVKLFGRCPKCKKEIAEQTVKEQFYSENREKARVSSSVNRMMQIKKGLKTKEEKDPFDF